MIERQGIRREADDVQRRQGAAPHGVYVRKRVRRSYATEVVGIVDHRSEEVHRLNEGDLVR